MKHSFCNQRCDQRGEEIGLEAPPSSSAAAAAAGEHVEVGHGLLCCPGPDRPTGSEEKAAASRAAMEAVFAWPGPTSDDRLQEPRFCGRLARPLSVRAAVSKTEDPTAANGTAVPLGQGDKATSGL